MPSSMKVTLDFPLPRTHCGFALGNGNFGALVWGGDTLNLTVSRADFWDHRGGEFAEGDNLYEKIKAAYDPADWQPVQAVFKPKPMADGAYLYSRRLPLGRFEMDIRRGLRLTQGTLDLRTGELTVHAARSRGPVPRPVRLAMHPTRHVLRIEDPDAVIAAARPRTAWEWAGDKLAETRLPQPRQVRRPGLTGWVQDVPADPALAALCRKVEGGFLVCLSRGHLPADALALGLDELASFAGVGWRAFVASGRAWWRAYWERTPVVHLPDPDFQRILDYALYKFGAATSPDSAIPCSLQGPWAEEYQLPPWSCDYHFNVNIQQIYTLAFPAGHAEHLLPLFDMLDRSRDVLRDAAKALVGVDDGLALYHAVDDRGYACGGISAGSVIDHACAGWTGHLYWLYYLHTGDREFLRDRAMPFLRGVMRVYEKMLVEKDGRLSLPVSISAEYQVTPRQRCGPDPSYQLACIHMLADALIEGARVLGLAVEPFWRRVKEKLPPYTLAGPPDRPRIAVMDGVDFSIPHRHHSHLAAIYPFDTLGRPDAATRAIIENSLHRWLEVGMSDWSEWCIPWAAIIEARAGYREAPWTLLKVWRDVFVNEGLATVYIPRFKGITVHRVERMVEPLEKYEVMQLDGTMAAATALYEMLVHTHGGVTRLFPAAPEAWRDVSFEDIRVPGPFLVSGRREGGRFRRARVLAPLGGRIRLDVPGRTQARLIRGRRRSVAGLPLELDLAAGESATLEG